MKLKLKSKSKYVALGVASAVVSVIYGCGGGGGGGGTPLATTTSVAITVADGLIQNAKVCLDKNLNGGCDAGEPTGTTNSSGMANLVVDNADVGKYPVIAEVGTNAVDVDNGPVTTAFTLKAPADQPAVITPLTNLVQSFIEVNGGTSAAAQAVVQAQTGISVSLFQDFTKSTSADSLVAATVARALVVTTQQQLDALNSTVGTTVAGTVITPAVLNQLVSQRIQALLPEVVAIIADPAVANAATPALKDAAILAGGQAFISANGLPVGALAVAIEINKQAAIAPVAATPAAGFQLQRLNFSDSNNFYFRAFTQSLAQATPDGSGNTRFVDRRYQRNSGVLATWGSGSDPWRNSDLFWNGSAWTGCPINFESTSSVRDALGNNAYNYCGGKETGQNNRATIDVAGRTMAAVLAEARAAGYTNLSIGDNSTGALSTSLGSTVFGTDAKVFYQTSTPLTNAVAYYPGASNWVEEYSTAVASGGVASTQAANVACNSSTDTNTSTPSTTLEGMMSKNGGTPCVYGQRTFTYNGTVYTSLPADEGWYQSTLSLGTIGNAPVGTGTAPGFYTTNTKLRVAFKGTGTNPVTYYACKERFNNGSVRNCTEIGTGSYTITTLGDGSRTLALNNMPPQVAQLNWKRVFVERGGKIYYGYQDRPLANKSVRLNTVAATELLTQLGLSADVPDPSTLLMTTVASYAGKYSGTLGGASTGTFDTSISVTGMTTCAITIDPPLGPYVCTFTISPTTPGSANISVDVNNGSVIFSGTADFNSGVVSGSYNNGLVTFAGNRL